MLKKLFLSVLILGAVSAQPAHADILDLLTGKSGSTIGNIIEGVFTKTDLSVADLAGTWETTGSAVTFKSENFLQKAGGLAGAAALETELNPYYERYGLTGSVMEIASDGAFSLKLGKMLLKGTITQGDGNFVFTFQAFGKIKIGQMTAYVEKSYNNLNVMFDASKAKSLISTIAKLSGLKMAKAASAILDSYDGACIGFKMKKIGDAPDAPQAGETVDADQPASSSQRGTGLLKSILGGKK